MSEYKGYVSREEEFGKINISEEVIASIAAMTIAEIEGVAGLAANIGTDIAEFLGKKNISKGVRIQADETGVNIYTAVLIKYGYPIPEIAKKIQEKVSTAVEDITGVKLNSVNVHISGIHIEKDKK